MNKGTVIFYDDDPKFTELFQSLMEDTGFAVKLYNNLDDLRIALKDETLMKQTRALVFDLAKDKYEAQQTREFEILEDIHQKFDELRVPIFIHSTYAQQVTHFNECGTVWKIVKSGTSMEAVVDTISRLDESGFIEAFSPGGVIEHNIMQELHRSFTRQFREGEIEKIIGSVKQTNPEDYKSRSIGIFRRIATKALMTEFLTPIAANDDTVNPIEHFYRRSLVVPIWTGDIWTKNDKSELVIVLTPRCDLANRKADTLILCEIMQPQLKLAGKKEARLKELHNYLTDNLLGKATRFLPPTPMFSGGMVYLSKHQTVSIEFFKKNYTYVISVSDDLTNEIIGKFVYYFLRTGITTMSTEEFDSYLKIAEKEINA